MKRIKPRALFIGPYPPPFSGPEMGMKLFLDSSLRNEFEIAFLCTNVRKTNRDKGRFGIAMLVAFVRFFSLLIWKIIRHRPQLVYYPVTATQLGWLGRDAPCLFLCGLFRLPIVIHLRASHFRLNYDRFLPAAQGVVRSALKRVDIAIVQSDQLHSQFLGLLPPERIKTLYQAVDSAEYGNPDLSDYQPGKVLFLGHLSQAKGYCDLLRAIQPVVSECANAKFFCGGTMRSGETNVFYNQVTGEKLRYENPYELEKQILASPIGIHYENLGVVEGQAKLFHLRSADIFVLPSYSEGFSRAVVEALCVGKPIVFTPVGAHAEVLNADMGAVVQPGHHDQLVSAIVRLLKDNENRDSIARRNYEFVRKNLDSEVIAKKLASILRQACAGELV